MTYWRTLFNRQSKPFKPTYPVTAIQQPTPITVTVSAGATGIQLGILDFSDLNQSDLLPFLESI